MKRIIATILLTFLLVSPAVTGYSVDDDYGGPLPNEPMWTINFYLDDVLYFGTYNEESIKDYVIDYHDNIMREYGDYDTYVLIEPRTLHYYYNRR